MTSSALGAEGQRVMRALMVPGGVGRSHVTRLVLIAHELRRRGAEVAFAVSQVDPLFAWEGFDTFDVPEVEVADFDRNVFGAYMPELVEACVDAELRAIEVFAPDVLVSDLRPSAAITAALAEIRHVTVINAYLARQFDPALVFGDHPGAVGLSRLVQRVQKRTTVGAFREVARRRGLRGLHSLDDLLEGDRTLLADLREFCPLSDLPSTSRYVGPLVWEGAPPLDLDAVELPDPDRPLIYVTTGNTGDRRLIDLVIEAFSDVDDLVVLITTGAYLDLSTVTTPSHIRLERFVPGSLALERAKVVVHCGGNGTTYQVIGHGRPAVVVPFTNDQRINAALVMRQGLGIALDPRRTRPANLVAAMAKAWRDTNIRARLERFRPLVTESDGPRSAAVEIDEFCRASS